MSEKLKPCPFYGDNDIRESDIKEVHPEFGISGYAVWCGNCGAWALLLEDVGEEVEVLGNIYENPDLIEQ